MWEHDLLHLEPVPTLLSRTRAELSAEFDLARRDRPARVSRAPGRLDVMGGIADYTGGLVCEMPLDRAAAVVLQERDDRELQIFSFNLYDEHHPFTFRMPLAGLANHSIDELRREFAAPGRKWAGYLAGCLYVLHEHKLVDLRAPSVRGLNLALLSTVPLGAGVSSSAAIEVATMMNLVEHFAIPRDTQLRSHGRQSVDASNSIDAMRIASLCQQVENRVVGAPCGIMDQVTSCAGESGALLRLLCQPHELQPPLKLPDNVRVLGINSNVKHSVGGGQYGKTRCAAFMGHAMIVAKMRDLGRAAGRELIGDPMHGYLANLDPDDYKKLFRDYLPQKMLGREFTEKFGTTIDTATTVEPETEYNVRHATDHHVMEARRVRRFAAAIERAAAEPAGTREQGQWLDQAGHMMYGSHRSYTHDAMLGAPECDVLVDLAREREKSGIYGAKITGGGSGGTVAILCDHGERTDAAIADILREYHTRAGRKPEAFTGSSPGAWQVGTRLL